MKLNARGTRESHKNYQKPYRKELFDNLVLNKWLNRCARSIGEKQKVCRCAAGDWEVKKEEKNWGMTKSFRKIFKVSKFYRSG
jgi:hypothetical protein